MPTSASRVHLFHKSHRLMSYVSSALSATHEGFWLGVLNRDQVNSLTEDEYLSREMWLSATFNLSGLYPWETCATDQFFMGCRSILVGAAGGGREVIALSRRGFDVDCFDCSQELLAGCKRLFESEGVKAGAVWSPPDHVPQELGIYQGLIMGWGGYSHIMGRRKRVEFLTQFRAHTTPGRPILLSFLVRPARSRYFAWTYRMSSLLRGLRLDHGEETELGDSLPAIYYHHFAEQEIRTELDEAGFEPIYYSEIPFGHAVGKAR